MTNNIAQLAPQSLWAHFTALNAVPRPSKKEERVIDFMKSFGAQLGLDTQVDKVGNVIIKKPASPGMEDRETLVLQSHLDMVHQKNASTVFDFHTQGIEMYVDGDWVRAKGTTLGADNGIGVAAIMAILSATDIAHPAIEALFTIDEETGMTGALNLEGGLLKGKILLNLDTEEDTELTIGCAGGVDVTAQGSYSTIPATGFSSGYKISVTGLTGGHSGGDIHLGRGNANKILTRVLYRLSQKFKFGLSSFDGGSLRNAIPREAFATIATLQDDNKSLVQKVHHLSEQIKTEYQLTDAALSIRIEACPMPEQILPTNLQNNILRALYSCPSGIYRMSPAIVGLVQSSNNLARVLIQDGQYSVQCLTRSSVDTEKQDLADAITATFEQIGARISLNGSYPGWQPKPDAPIIQLMSSLYEELFGSKAHVNAVHAGLECGILGQNYPDMQMISFGPNIYGAHSPDERVQISSVQKFWQFFTETLKRSPKVNA